MYFKYMYDANPNPTKNVQKWKKHCRTIGSCRRRHLMNLLLGTVPFELQVKQGLPLVVEVTGSILAAGKKKFVVPK